MSFPGLDPAPVRAHRALATSPDEQSRTADLPTDLPRDPRGLAMWARAEGLTATRVNRSFCHVSVRGGVVMVRVHSQQRYRVDSRQTLSDSASDSEDSDEQSIDRNTESPAASSLPEHRPQKASTLATSFPNGDESPNPVTASMDLDLLHGNIDSLCRVMTRQGFFKTLAASTASEMWTSLGETENEYHLHVQDESGVPVCVYLIGMLV